MLVNLLGLFFCGLVSGLGLGLALAASSNDRGFVTAADLHKTMDKAVADGWQPQKDGESRPWVFN